MAIYLDSLNAQQKKAVVSDSSALLILAGAGSGKTRVLTTKIAYLILEKHVDPWEILAFTFTNKAATEMKERVAKALERPVDSMWIGTFHSICVRILRREIERLGYTPNFTIYDTQDQKTLIKAIMKDQNLSDTGMNAGAYLSQIAALRGRGVSYEDALNAAHYDRERVIARVYRDYEMQKRRNNALDFDDLIFQTLELLQNFPEVREKYRRQFRYLFVDEYQDTNHAQYELILALTSPEAHISVVGDADQSIYGWRGADINNILDFEKDFQKSHTILLEQNYRSTKQILDAANHLIDHNEQRRKKNLWTENAEGEPVRFRATQSEHEEAMTVLEWTEKAIRKGYRYADMAVLYRTNAQSRAIEEILMRSSVPYHVVGGLKFYDRAEIKDLIAYMNVVVNPTDDIALQRIINVPKRGIGAASVEALRKVAGENGMSMMDGLEDEEIFSLLTSAQRSKMKPFRDLILSLREQLASMSLVDFVNTVFSESGYRHMLEISETVEDQARMENVEAFVNAVAQYEEEEPEASISDYLQNLSLFSDLDKTEANETGMTLMTIHSAKGLEFPVVFLVGLEEGLFPSRMSMEEGHLEEERRLMYVAMTRAMKELYLTAATSRRIYGQMLPQQQSRFIQELGDTIQDESVIFSAQGDSDYAADRGKRLTGGHRTGFADDALREEYERQRENFRRKIREKKERLDRQLKTPFRVGDKVTHPKFGQGTVVSVVPNPDGDELTIAFDRRGLKRLNALAAPLQKMSR